MLRIGRDDNRHDRLHELDHQELAEQQDALVKERQKTRTVSEPKPDGRDMES